MEHLQLFIAFLAGKEERLQTLVSRQRVEVAKHCQIRVARVVLQGFSQCIEGDIYFASNLSAIFGNDCPPVKDDPQARSSVAHSLCSVPERSPCVLAK